MNTSAVQMTVSGMYFIVGALIEVPVAAFFLYNLLGWSAFAGFVVLILASPAQSYIMKRNIKVSQFWSVISLVKKTEGIVADQSSLVKGEG